MRNSVVLILLLVHISAGAQFRKYSNEFLNIGAGAWGLGMGGAQVAIVNDHTAGYWNPAGLSLAERYPSFGAMHAEYFAGIGKYDILSASLPTNNERRTIGITALRFAVDDIPNTLFLVEPDGSLNYNNISSFTSADHAFLFSVAQELSNDRSDHLSIGGSAKIIYRQVGNFAKAWGFGLDAGLMFQNNGWYAGAMLRDVTTTYNVWAFSFTDREKQVLYLTQNDIPLRSTEITVPRMTLGIARHFDLNEKVSLLTAFDGELSFGGKRNTLIRSSVINIDPKVGVEMNYASTVSFRMGVGNFQQALSDGDTLDQKKVWICQPSIGAGFRTGNVRIDYALTNLANQSAPLFSHIFSLRVDLDKKKEQ